MNARLLIAARVVAWTVAAGAVGAVMLGYDSLPATIPLTRWTAAPKSVFLALRIPLINLLTLGLIELRSPALHRVMEFARADAVVAVLLLTGAAKAGLEAAGILMLPVSFAWTLIPLVAVISMGLATAAFLGRNLLHPEGWRQLKMTRLETAWALALILGIAALNLPLVARSWWDNQVDVSKPPENVSSE